jgi:xanthine dehydrogenase small subunit
MIRFILNDKMVRTSLPPGSTVLDFIRYQKRLTGTKTGCREGDCGACTVLVGRPENGKLSYRSMTSCLMPLANAQGNHIVTVEGINMDSLSPVQAAMAGSNGTQCGFCTPGFVMSFTGFVLHPRDKNYQKAIEHIDGNICRCTGYKSIERAAGIISDTLKEKPESGTVPWLVSKGFLPPYFLDIPDRLQSIAQENQAASEVVAPASNRPMRIGGGTDLLVQKHTQVRESSLSGLLFDLSLKGIRQENGKIYAGASVTVSEFSESPEIRSLFPGLKRYIKLVSSTPIRNMATLAGNLVNASPIGDMTVFLLALDADVELKSGESSRRVLLRDFYKGYKVLDKAPEEIISRIIFQVPPQGSVFNFEKVCKRTHLDIASVNSACLLRLDADGRVADLNLSAGGVFAWPKWLGQSAECLKGKILNRENLTAALEQVQAEIAPISDARGTAEYKRMLLRQLILAHFQPYLSENELFGLLSETAGNTRHANS